MNLAVLGAVFGLVFVAELPDKTAVASLVLGARHKSSWVFAGIAAAFTVHVVLAVAAGSLIALLPRRPVEAVVGTLFLIGAVLLWREGAQDEDEEEASAEDSLAADAGFRSVAGTAFAVVFVAEFGDLTQILTANLAARYKDPISVGVGALLALWAVGLLAIVGGKTLLRVIPMEVVVRLAAVVMVGLSVYSLVKAVTG